MDCRSIDPLYTISLSLEDAAALQSLHASETNLSTTYQGMQQKYQKILYVKDSYLYNHCYDELNKKLDDLNQSISEQKCLKIRYKTSDGKIISRSFRPLKISYDSNENLYSVISIHEGKIMVNRVDQILSIDPCTENIETPDTGILEKIAPNVWGNCFSDEPEHVKIRFYNEANVWNKVKKELANRTNGKLYEQDGYLYYEDTVYGISKFRSWIYGYGSSAIVIEPVSLREQIIESLKIRKQRG